MPEPRLLAVPDGLIGERVDTAMARLLGLSRTTAADLASSGAVRVNGRLVGKSERLPEGALLEVQFPEVSGPTADAPAPATPVPGMGILFEDGDLIVIDKPAGVAAHPSPGWTGPTVVGALTAAGHQVATSGAAERQGIVHRLDAGTSGVMMVAKSEVAYRRLKQAFRDRTVDKVYHAVVQGHPDPLVGTIDAPIGRRPGHDYRFAVVSDGKPSITHYAVLEAFRGGSLVEVELETGRTHQIRVHFSALRHPCVGDTTYSADPQLAQRLGLSRQWLHAVRLGFEHPITGERVEFSSDYPDDLAHALTVLTGP